MIVQDIRRAHNPQGRCGFSFRDGQFTRYLEIIDRVITVCASDLDSAGNPVVLHENWDLTTVPDFQPVEVSAVPSGIDGHLLVTCVGFTSDSSDSRRVTVKCDLTVREAWQTYPA